MTQTRTYNDQIPTDPITWAVLLTLAATAIGRLDAEQAAALRDLLQTAGSIAPLLLIGRR